MKKILIIAHFSEGLEREANGRFHYLAELLSSEYEVELLTSSFYHTKKAQHLGYEKQHSDVMVAEKTLANPDKTKASRDLPYKVSFAYEPGYKKNVSLKRFYSHWVLGRSTKKYLESLSSFSDNPGNGPGSGNVDKPDLIYCAVPSLDIALAASRYAKINKIPFIVDIQDLWPQAFKMVLNIPFLSDLLFYPMVKQEKEIYRSASYITAVSHSYLNHGLNIAGRESMGEVAVYLGTDLSYFDSVGKEFGIVKPDNEFWIIYIGTLGRSYNIELMLEAVSILRTQVSTNKDLSSGENIKLKILGDGPEKTKFEKYAKDHGIAADFLGRRNYGEMVGYLKASDIAINPIHSGSAASIINKHGDYAMAGLPVISTQESPEYIDLLEKYKAGFSCNNKDAEKMAEYMKTLYNNKDMRLDMGRNSRRMGEDKFDRGRTYRELAVIIEQELIYSGSV